MEKRHYIIISPDLDYFYIDEEGGCGGIEDDAISNSDFELGTPFLLVVPGISEWVMQYVLKTDFANTTTDPSFDWQTWHAQGLLFAKYVSEHLPGDYFLKYQPPFEDRSNLISDFDVSPDSIAEIIKKFPLENARGEIAPSYKDNLEFSVAGSKPSTISIKYGHCVSSIILDIPDYLVRLKLWLDKIEKGEDDVVTESLNVNGKYSKIIFFPQRIGLHKDMGQVWIGYRDDQFPDLFGYVNTKEFVCAFRAALTEIAIFAA
mgnify:CR=1 FL=1